MHPGAATQGPSARRKEGQPQLVAAVGHLVWNMVMTWCHVNIQVRKERPEELTIQLTDFRMSGKDLRSHTLVLLIVLGQLPLPRAGFVRFTRAVVIRNLHGDLRLGSIP
jgi:hypothetical protein